MYSTKYVKAKDIDDAATIMAAAEDGKFLAGGMTLIPTLKQRLANPDSVSYTHLTLPTKRIV